MKPLSIVTTLYQSEAYVDEFYRRVSQTAARVAEDFEIIFVDDGSPDDSCSKAVALARQDSKVRVIELSRNFGHYKAMMTGLAQARGELVFLIDSDLEEEPELLEAFHQKLTASGADVVFGVQESRKGGWFERLSGRVFFAVFNLLSTDPIPTNVAVVRLMKARYVEALVRHQERQVLIAGLWAITGFDQQPQIIRKGHKGRSSYTLRKKIAALVDAITSFSIRPLVWIFYLGLAIMAGSIAGIAYLLIRRYVFADTLLAGWPSLMVTVCFLGGLMIFCQGVIGIYLSKVYMETKQRPYSIIKQIHEQAPGGGR